MPKDLKWFQSHQALIELAYWLNDRGDLTDVANVLYFFEKPWKYQEEWEAYVAERDAEAVDQFNTVAAWEESLAVRNGNIIKLERSL
jgi:hypothetical protein